MCLICSKNIVNIYLKCKIRPICGAQETQAENSFFYVSGLTKAVDARKKPHSLKLPSVWVALVALQLCSLLSALKQNNKVKV